MRSVTKDCLSPRADGQRALDEPIAERSGQFGFGVGFDAGMVTKHFKARAIELAKPTFDWNFPVRMVAKIPADDAHSHWFVKFRRRSKGRCRVLACHDLANSRPVTCLQLSFISTLIR